jgi:hypothetical protein
MRKLNSLPLRVVGPLFFTTGLETGCAFSSWDAGRLASVIAEDALCRKCRRDNCDEFFIEPPEKLKDLNQKIKCTVADNNGNTLCRFIEYVGGVLDFSGAPHFLDVPIPY